MLYESPRDRRIFVLSFPLLLLFGLFLLSPILKGHAEAPGQSTAMNHSLYLPTLQRADPVRQSIFGGEFHGDRVDLAAPPARDAQLTWARYNGIDWRKVEPTPGARNWETMASTDASLRDLSANGLSPILIIQNTAEWARQVPHESCGPIKQEYLELYAHFVGDVVRRYSAPPYNVRHFEIYNEPDIDADLIGGGSGGYGLFGCWGDSTDPYYGGGYYGEMLKRVYPAVKAADPRAQVLIGGLLLFCDHTHPGNSSDGCHPSKFFEGILRSGAGPYFDFVSYHGYPLWKSTREDWDLTYQPWAHRGGVVLGKLDFLRTTMSQYGVTKPVLLTEGGLLCYNTACPVAALQQDQANYAIRLYSRAKANGLAGALWFSVVDPGWRQSGLLAGDFTPRPAYYTVQFLASRLNGTTVVSQERSGPLEMYTFRRASKHYRLAWTNSAVAVAVTLPAGARVYNQFGVDITPIDLSVAVGFDPILIEYTN